MTMTGSCKQLGLEKDKKDNSTLGLLLAALVGSLPTITSFTPTAGDAGNTVTITGTNFSTTASSNSVKFNGTTATVSSATATSLTVTVPTGATTGTITVTTSSGTATSTSSYTVYTYTVTTFAGTAGSSGTTDGTGTAARFNVPVGAVFDSSGNLYVSDHSNYCIRKVTSAGVVTTFAGLCGTGGTTDGTGTAARFWGPSGIVFDSSGNLYVADTGNDSIRKITSSGVVTTFAGLSGTSGTTDGTGTAARFSNPIGIVFDSSGNLFVVDSANYTIRKITSGGVVTTFAGTVGSGGFSDGIGVSAKFYVPGGIVIDSNGNLFVADAYNHAIRKITSGGVVSTFAGTVGSSGVNDGTGTSAKFNLPVDISTDSNGNFYVSDYANYTIRKITSGGVVTTIAGTAGSSGSSDGMGVSAKFKNPRGITVNSNGNLFVTDGGNHTIRKIVP